MLETHVGFWVPNCFRWPSSSHETERRGDGGTTHHGNGGLFWRVENLEFISLYTDHQASLLELQFPDIAVRVRFLIYQVWMIDFLSIIEWLIWFNRHGFRHFKFFRALSLYININQTNICCLNVSLFSSVFARDFCCWFFAIFWNSKGGGCNPHTPPPPDQLMF